MKVTYITAFLAVVALCLSRGVSAAAGDVKAAPLASGCPTGWSKAVGTVYDSWPKPGTKECIDYSGCEWAGLFNSIDAGPERGPCKNGAKKLDGGNGDVKCRFPESTVKSWRVAATWERDAALLGKQVQVLIEGQSKIVTLNVLDTCSNSDCDGCCSSNTGNGKYKLIDIEKWGASALLGFNPSTPNFDINNVNYPNAKGKRPGAPESDVMPLCYKVVGTAPTVG